MCRKFSPMRFLSIDRRRPAARGFWRTIGLACLSVACAVGCSTVSRDYPGVSHDELWQAALGAANNPKYSDWFVTENGVFVDKADNRIEIYRELKRDYAPPGAALRRESETWTFSVLVDTDDRVPKVFLDTRTAVRTPNFWKQADHFFGEIDARLAQLPTDPLNTMVKIPTPLIPNKNALEAPTALDSSSKIIPDLAAPAVANPSGIQPPLTAP